MFSPARILLCRSASVSHYALRMSVRHPEQVSHLAKRTFAKEYYKLRKKKVKEDPWKVLNVSRDDSYADIKKIFIRIAMDYHPDTSAALTEEDEEEHKEIFMAARTAFEQLTSCPNGQAILRSESEQWEEEEFNSWFQEETGHDMPFMDQATMKEVAAMTEQLGGEGGGLDRDGGMWTLARMVSSAVKSGGDGRDILRLDSGEIRDRSINGILRRKRRR
jgi:DnaJ-class molecular chaperone